MDQVGDDDDDGGGRRLVTGSSSRTLSSGSEGLDGGVAGGLRTPMSEEEFLEMRVAVIGRCDLRPINIDTNPGPASESQFVGVVVIGGGILAAMTFIVLAQVIEGVVSGLGMIEAKAMVGLL
jgi:hypothetical protein